MPTLRKAFYLNLACQNVRRNRKTYLPYIFAVAVMSGVFMLMTGLLFSDSVNNVPQGQSATMMFSFGMVVFAIFTFFFMSYINKYMIGRRKKEFGLYGILGLEKRHVARVLIWENVITRSLGVLLGALLALVFGQLLFLLLMRLIRAVASGTFKLPAAAILVTGLLFVAIFVFTTITNLWQVRVSSPMELLQSERKGDKDGKLLVPVAILGGIMLLSAYYFAWTIENPSIALGVFFLLATLVIIATYLLMRSGSIAVLRLLRANKRFYYQPRHFVAVSGMFQRMRQNARSLSAICILSTMLVVTMSGTLSLYLGREEMTRGMYPYDMEVYLPKNTDVATARAFEEKLIALSDEYHVTISADPGKLVYERDYNQPGMRNNFVDEDDVLLPMQTVQCFNGSMRFDASGTEEDCLAYEDALRTLYNACFPESDERPSLHLSSVYSSRREGYGVYGGLLFLGAFFSMLFLSITVLLIYFKQISEGYEDKAQFMILQKVGMDDSQVRETINAQVLWIFFLPLGATILHMAFASRIMTRMLMTFMLYDWGLVLTCIGGVLLVFALVYLVVYLLTAKVYYRIVKW